jgi:hypothetical protein
MGLDSNFTNNHEEGGNNWDLSSPSPILLLGCSRGGSTQQFFMIYLMDFYSNKTGF